MHCITQPVPNYRWAGLRAVTALLTCPSPKRDLLHHLGLRLLLTPVAGTGGIWQQGWKVQRGGLHRKWEEKGTAGWSSFEISQRLSQLTVCLCSTHCRILHYLFDFTYSFRFIISLYLWYNLSQGHIHESRIWMIHVHPYSQSSNLLQLKLSDKVFREKRHPDIHIVMHLKHQHICNHLSRWHKNVYLCPFCFDKEITIISHYEVFHSFIEKHIEMYVIICIFQLPLIKDHITYVW